MQSRLFAIAALFLVVLVSPSAGQVPHTLSYQGVLTDSVGHPKSDGTYAFSFRLYSSSSGGSALWTETKTLSVNQGLFSTVLGNQIPINLPFDAPYWLSIQVASDPELAPRIALTSAGYSIHSVKSDTALYAKSSLVGAGLALPYSDTVSSASDLFSLNNTGTGRAGYFSITNAGSSAPALEARIFSGGGSGISSLSLQGFGVYGESGTATGVYGYCSENIGVGGMGGHIGLFGQTNSVNSPDAGVRGNATASTGGAAGVYGDATANPGGTGVYGTGGQAGGLFTGGTYGVFGISSTGVGAEGVTNATGTNSAGVLGVAVPGTGQIIGVRGAAINSPQGIGVQAEGQARGVYAVASGGGGDGLYGQADGINGNGVHGFADNGGSSYALWGQSTNGFALVCSGKLYQANGIFEAHPTSTVWSTNKPATVKLTNGVKVKLFAEEAAEVYFNDYGEASLQNGRAHIDLDPNFVQTVTIDGSHPMKVFVQLEGDCKGVYVTNKSATGFDVVELQGGTSSAQFSYRIACKRKYYEDERLATEEQDTQYNKRMLDAAWPEVAERQRADEARANAHKPEAPKPLPAPTYPGMKR